MVSVGAQFNSFRRYVFAAFPVLATLVLQRLFHVVDNRMVGVLGSEYLTIYNIQYGLTAIGEYLSAAAATAVIVLWNRDDSHAFQQALFRYGSRLTLLVSLISVALFGPMTIMTFLNLNIDPSLTTLAGLHIVLGAFNLALQALVGIGFGALIATGRQNLALKIAFIVLLLNTVFDSLSVYTLAPTFGRGFGLIGVSLSSTVVLAGTLVFYRRYLFAVQFSKRATNTHPLPLEMRDVWRSEYALAFIRSIAPIVFALQSAEIVSSAPFLTTYNLALHIAYLSCLPLASGIQIVVRELSKTHKDQNSQRSDAVLPFVLTSLLPTFVILGIAAFDSVDLIRGLFNYTIPNDHAGYARAFFLSCMIGQIGHVVAIGLRVRLLSRWVARNFLVSELMVHLGLTQILISLDSATPTNQSFAVLAYTVTYLGLNVISLWRVRVERPTK